MFRILLCRHPPAKKTQLVYEIYVHPLQTILILSPSNINTSARPPPPQKMGLHAILKWLGGGLVC